MKRNRSNYHSLHVLKDACPKLRRAILANSGKALITSVGEWVLQGNVKLSNCKKRKLRKFRRQLRTVADRHVPVARKKKLIPLLAAVLPTIASLVYDYFKSS